LIYLVIIILLLVLYTSWRIDKIAGIFGAAIDKFTDDIKTLKALAERTESVLSSDWTRDVSSSPTRYYHLD
jgi:hypothetical protein